MRRGSGGASPLEAFAVALLQNPQKRSSMTEEGTPFPMYTVPMRKLLLMQQVKPHEELLEQGIVVVFDESMGKAIFVSHQWLGRKHPDPYSHQLKVLQNALRNMLAGMTYISPAVNHEAMYGHSAISFVDDLQATTIFLWYDFFSCPQADEHHAERHNAIACIPSYVTRCEHFVILCPGLGHESGEILCQKTWEERGWCRAERTARKLALNGGPVIVIESETSQLFLTEIATCEPPVAEGRFSVDLDRKRVANIVLQLIRRRLLLLLEQNNLTEYRFLYNQQSLLLKGSGVDCVELGIPGFSPESFPDPEELLMAKFMHQNGFSSLKQRDAAGWSPMCYAAMSGNASLVSALLRRNADANDRIRKAKPQVFFSKNMHAIAIAACFRSNEVIKVLLAAHAKVDAKDGHKHTALHWSAGSNDAETVRLLVNGGADHTLKQNLGVSVLQLACFNCSGNAVRELLRLRPKQNVEQCFHYSFMLFAGSSELVQILLDAKADMNEQLDFAKTKAWPMWLLCNFSGWKYKRGLSRTRLCRMGYHHHLATPLMFTVLGGAADAAWTLLTAGARRDLKNSRGKTAFDLAFEFGTNPELVAALDPDSKLPKAFPEPSEEDEEEVPVEVRGKVPQGTCSGATVRRGAEDPPDLLFIRID